MPQQVAKMSCSDGEILCKIIDGGPRRLELHASLKEIIDNNVDFATVDGNIQMHGDVDLHRLRASP